MNALKKLLIIVLLLVPVTVHAQTTTGPSTGIDEDCDLSVFNAALAVANNAVEEEDLKTIFAAMDILAIAITGTQDDCLAKSTNVDTASEGTDRLLAPKNNGVYLVGVDIMPGRWETTGSSEYCHWQRTSAEGATLDTHYGASGGTITVQATDYVIQLFSCGDLIYVENRVPELAPDAYDPKGDGFYTVGIEIAPGRWRSTGSGDGCYYSLNDAYQDINENHFGESGITITVQPTDYEVEFDECGTWEYLGEPE